jgi:hypothetical protein
MYRCIPLHLGRHSHGHQRSHAGRVTGTPRLARVGLRLARLVVPLAVIGVTVVPPGSGLGPAPGEGSALQRGG